MDDIKVKVHSYGEHRALSLVWFDPISGKKKAKSAKTADWREAERAAAELEKKLTACTVDAAKLTWEAFKKRYLDEHVTSLKPRTRDSVDYAFGRIKEFLDPDKLVKLNASALSTFQSKLRETDISESTIANILRHIKAALGWAVSIGLLSAVPKIVMPKRAKGRKMKGGAVIGEQFDRMLDACEVIRPKDAGNWKRYIRGLWLSGLRLNESLALSWDPGAPFAVDLTGKKPAFRIRGEAQKSGKDERLPMTPDFAAFLLETPEAERRGRVFRLDSLKTGHPLKCILICKTVADIGDKAGAIVNPETGGTATAHDLRRSFGTRWAKRVMPAVLQKLMRHASINTTMSYYVDLNVDEMADDLWREHGEKPASGNNLGNIRSPDGGESKKEASQETTQPLAVQGVAV